MYAVRVMPVARGIFKDELTFFSRDSIPAGRAVTVTVRGRKIPGIVISSRDVREEKQDIRTADFSLKKLDAAEPPKRVFSEAFMEAVRRSALWHGAHEGIVMAALVSNTVLSSFGRVEEAHEPKNRAGGVRPETLLLQSEYGERIRTYRNLVREAFARNSSVMLIAPTVIEAETLAEELSRGIENRVLLLTGEVAKKKLLSNWNQALTETTPILLVGTAFLLSHPRPDIDTLIVERESAKSYRMRERPLLDLRRVARYFSEASGVRLILADFPLRTETRYLIESHEAEELARLQARAAGASDVRIVDTRSKENKHGERRVFTTLTPDTKAEIASMLKSKGRVAVFAARRGLSPLTVCNDCGTPVTDTLTGTPMVLHKTGKGNVFVSHKSGAIVPAETSCKTCGGWNLVTLGIGVDRVHQELLREFPETPLFLFTKDAAPTHKTAKKLSESFFAEKGAIVVGTERMLPYLTRPVDLTAVASIDSMLSLPAWRAHEQTHSILYYLRERAKNALIVETRDPEHAVMRSLALGNPSDFYAAEIAEREKYAYPPFSVFIGLTLRGSFAEVERQRKLIGELFASRDLVGPMPPEATGRNIWSAKAVIRLKRDEWPDPALSQELKNLPPSVLVSIDPDEIV